MNGSSLRVISLAGETITRIDSGDYRVFFYNVSSYCIIMLSVKDFDGNNNYDNLEIAYFNQTNAGFYINGGDSDNGRSVKTDVDLEFMFVVYSI